MEFLTFNKSAPVKTKQKPFELLNNEFGSGPQQSSMKPPTNRYVFRDLDPEQKKKFFEFMVNNPCTFTQDNRAIIATVRVENMANGISEKQLKPDNSQQHLPKTARIQSNNVLGVNGFERSVKATVAQAKDDKLQQQRQKTVNNM